MATTIISIGFWIYTFILTGRLIWNINTNKEAYQKNKKLQKNGILTKATIVKIYQPKKKYKRSEINILDNEITSTTKRKNELVITYEYNTEKSSTLLEGTTKITLDSAKNVEIEKALYKVGDTIDIFYLKEDITISDIADKVRTRYYDAEIMFLCVNIVGILLSLFVLFALKLLGISEEMDTLENGLDVTWMFFPCLLSFLSVGIAFASIRVTKDYIQSIKRKRRGIREKGEILKIWFTRGHKSGFIYHIKYTYPAISPFYLQTKINSKLDTKIQQEQEIEVLYLEEDKFSSDIVGNKNILFEFWVLFFLVLFMIPFCVFLIHFYVLFVFVRFRLKP